jgi:hypothetical protein
MSNKLHASAALHPCFFFGEDPGLASSAWRFLFVYKQPKVTKFQVTHNFVTDDNSESNEGTVERRCIDFRSSLSFTGRDGADVITEGNDSNSNCLNSHHWMKLATH